MRRIALLLSCVIFVVGLSSCTVSFVGNYPNTPLGNYDFFFAQLDSTYAYKDYVFEQDRSLSDIRALERASLDNNSSWNDLADALYRVINVHIKDPHVYSMYSPVADDDIYVYLASRGDDLDAYLPDVQKTNGIALNTSGYLYHGVYERTGAPSIGYLYVDELTESVGGTDRASAEKAVFATQMDAIVERFRDAQVKGLIVDLRTRAGGAVYNGRQIAGRMMTEKKVFMHVEYPTSPLQYASAQEAVEPLGKTYLQGMPLVVIINSRTCSGSEMLALMLKQASGFKGIIGKPSHGCAGTIIDRELLNGWVFRLTSSRTYAADKSEYFKVGITPDHDIRYDSLAPDTDEPMIKAVEILSQ